MGFPPDPQEIRARKIGHVVVNSNLDRPWSQYFCCVLAAHREFVQKYPVATKRALRAILKGTDVCAAEPDRAGRVAWFAVASEDPRLHAPIGLKLGDKTPGEIAISILAELLLLKSGGSLAHSRLAPKAAEAPARASRR